MKKQGYTGVRSIPMNITLIGDRGKCESLIGRAESQLRILEAQMSFQGLQQGSRKIKGDGYIIECWKCFSLQGVKITTFAPGPQPEKEIELPLPIPLVASGLCVDDETLDEYTGKSLAYYAGEGAFSTCSPYTPHYMSADYTFFQVRYAPETITYGDDDQEKTVNFSLSIGKTTSCLNTVIVNVWENASAAGAQPPESIDDDVADGNHVYYLLPGIKVQKFKVSVDQAEVDPELAFFTANFNEDKTKLYIAYGANTDGIVEDYNAPISPAASVNTVIYDRLVSDNGVVTWVQASTSTFGSALWYMAPGFVSTDGYVHGLYDPTLGSVPPVAPLAFNYAKFHIETETIVSEDYGCRGYTIYDGDFVGIELKYYLYNIAELAPLRIIDGGSVVMQSHPFSTGLDISYINYLEHEGNYGYFYASISSTGYESYYPYQANPTILSDDGTTQVSEWRDTQTYEQYYPNMLEDPPLERFKEEQCRFGDVDFLTIRTGSYGYSSRDYVQTIVTTSAPGHSGHSADVTCTVDQWEEDYLETVEVHGGAVSLFSDNRRFEVNGTFTQHSEDGFPFSSCTWNGESVDCSAINRGWPLYNPDSSVPENTGPHLFFYFEGARPEDVSRGAVADIKWPIEITGSYVGLSSFIAWDNNEDGLVIKGMRYRAEPDDSNVLLKIMVDDFDVTENLLSCTGFDSDDFYYLGFLY
jgi:hypothetical protein